MLTTPILVRAHLPDPSTMFLSFKPRRPARGLAQPAIRRKAKPVGPVRSSRQRRTRAPPRLRRLIM